MQQEIRRSTIAGTWYPGDPKTLRRTIEGYFRNVPDLAQWLADVAAGRRAGLDRVALTPRVLVEDSLIFGLRMNEGVDLPTLRERYPAVSWDRLEALASRLVEEGLATRSAGGCLQLTLRGRLVADAVGAQVMEALAETGAADANRIE